MVGANCKLASVKVITTLSVNPCQEMTDVLSPDLASQWPRVHSAARHTHILRQKELKLCFEIMVHAASTVCVSAAGMGRCFTG